MSSYRPHDSNVVRDFMLWLFDVPHGEPYVSVSLDITWENAARYLDTLNAAAPGAAPSSAGNDVRVGPHHLFTAAIGRVYKEFPSINARIHGRKIYRLDAVDVVMPVNLLGSEADRELSMVIVRGVDKLDPRGVAAALRPQIVSERKGRPANAAVRTLTDFGSRSTTALSFTLRSLATLAHDPRTAPLLTRAFPVSTLITNVGAAMGTLNGARFRAVAFSPPTKLVHIGSVIGLGPIDRQPIVDGDTIRIAPVLPIGFIFDHRLVDGVLASRILGRLADILQDPAAHWPSRKP